MRAFVALRSFGARVTRCSGRTCGTSRSCWTSFSLWTYRTSRSLSAGRAYGPDVTLGTLFAGRPLRARRAGSTRRACDALGANRPRDALRPSRARLALQTPVTRNLNLHRLHRSRHDNLDGRHRSGDDDLDDLNVRHE